MEEKDLPYDINDVLKYVSVLRLYQKERLYTVILNDYKVISCFDITKRSYTSSVTAEHIEGIKMANNLNCNQVIFCHNHPGCLCIPSGEDICNSEYYARISKDYGVTVIDDLIVTFNSYSSRILDDWYNMHNEHCGRYIILNDEQKKKHEKDLEEFNKLFIFKPLE